MASLVTLAGIDEAIAHLALREDTLKYRLIEAIRSHFPTDESLAAIDTIDTEEIIRQVWETDQKDEIQQKRKNLSGLKSSLNKSLRQLSQKGLNPEGVVLGRDNTFIVSEEKKNSLIEQLGLGAESAPTLKEAVKSFQTIFSELIREKGIEAVQELLAGLEQTKAYLEQAARETGLVPATSPAATSPAFQAEKDRGPEKTIATVTEDGTPQKDNGDEHAAKELAPGPLMGPAEPGQLPAEDIVEVDGILEEAGGAEESLGDFEEAGSGGDLQPAASPVDAAAAEVEAEHVFFADEIEEAELTRVEPEPVPAPSGDADDPAAKEAAGPESGEPADGVVVETEQIFFEDEIEEAELTGDEPEIDPAASEEAASGETAAGIESENPPAADEELEAEELLFEDEIEEAELTRVEPEPVPAPSGDVDDLAAREAAGPESGGPADGVVVETEQIFFEDEIEEAELTGDEPEIAPEAAAFGETAGPESGDAPAAGEEVEAGQFLVDGEEVVYEDEIEEAGAAADEQGPDAGNAIAAGEAAGHDSGDPAAEVVETEQIFFEDEIEEAELTGDEPEIAPEAAAFGETAGPESGDAPAAGEEAEAGQLLVDGEEVIYEDEIEEAGPADETAAAPAAPGSEGPQAASHEALMTADGEPAAAATAGEGPVIETEALFFEDEIEEIEEVLEERATEAGEANAATAVSDDLLPEADLEEVELLADEEVEFEEGETTGGPGPGGGPGSFPDHGKAPLALPDQGGPGDTMGLLEVLSGLMGGREADPPAGKAVAGPANDPYLSQLLSRFAPRYFAVPAGAYDVGSFEPRGRELPRRQVRLAAFRVGQFPVTNDLFELFVRETGYVTEAEKRGYGLVYEGRFANHTEPDTGRAVFSIDRGTSMRQADGADWRHPAGPESTIQGKHRHPVVQVTLADALAFAGWAGKRLPTEEEWEVAAGAHDGRPFPWGHDWSPGRANVLASLWGGTTAIDEHGPGSASPFGVSDLIGNVYEWTATVHGSKGGGLTDDHGGLQREVRDGGLCKRPQGAADARHRPASYTEVCEQADNKADAVPCGRLHGRGLIYVLKGGSWTTGGRIAIAHRTVEKETHCSNIVGFRCAGEMRAQNSEDRRQKTE